MFGIGNKTSVGEGGIRRAELCLVEVVAVRTGRASSTRGAVAANCGEYFWDGGVDIISVLVTLVVVIGVTNEVRSGARHAHHLPNRSHIGLDIGTYFWWVCCCSFCFGLLLGCLSSHTYFPI